MRTLSIRSVSIFFIYLLHYQHYDVDKYDFDDLFFTLKAGLYFQTVFIYLKKWSNGMNCFIVLFKTWCPFVVFFVKSNE